MFMHLTSVKADNVWKTEILAYNILRQIICNKAGANKFNVLDV